MALKSIVLLFFLFLSAPLLSTSMPDFELQLALAALHAGSHHLFANAIHASDLRYELTSASSEGLSYTLLAPPDSSLFLLDLASEGHDYVRSLRRHIVTRSLSATDLRLLPVGTLLATLLQGQDLVIGRRNGTDVVTVDGVGISGPDLYVTAGISVHGVDSILAAGSAAETGDSSDSGGWSGMAPVADGPSYSPAPFAAPEIAFPAPTPSPTKVSSRDPASPLQRKRHRSHSKKPRHHEKKMGSDDGKRKHPKRIKDSSPNGDEI